MEAAVRASNYAGLLPRSIPRFQLPTLGDSSRALVLGMGGGCDVFAAAAVASIWAAESPSAAVFFGNCIGDRRLPDDHACIAPHLHRVPALVKPLEAGDEAYGSTRLEQSVPRGADGSPFLFVLPKDGRDASSIEEMSALNTAALSGALAALRVDQVLAVDLGGDSLSGGRDFHREDVSACTRGTFEWPGRARDASTQLSILALASRTRSLNAGATARCFVRCVALASQAALYTLCWAPDATARRALTLCEKQ